MTRIRLTSIGQTSTANAGQGFTTIGTGSTLLLAANPNRLGFRIWNLDPLAVVYGSLGINPAVVSQGFVINPNQSSFGMPDPSINGGVVYTGDIYVVSTQGTTNLSYIEL